MTTSTFNNVFSLSVFHDYFENLICNCLVFTPTHLTTKTIQRYGFKIKNNLNGFEFFATNQTSIANYLEYLEQASEQNFFEFEIKTTNQNFMLFTQMPSNNLGQLQYSSSNITIKNGKPQLSATHLSQNETPVLGTLKIYFQDIIALVQNNSSCHFEIIYQAKATQWNYYIINKSQLVLNHLAINSKSMIDFGSPIPIKIQNGDEALFFSSGNKHIKLCNVAKYQFDLINKTESNQTKKATAGKIIFKSLPNPSPAKTETVLVNETRTETSPMYVYI